MVYDPSKYHRRSVRLAGYDYSGAGAYYLTCCTWNREFLFGEIVAGVMRLSELGRVVYDEWLRSSEIRQELILDEFCIMPNHIHGIVIIRKPNMNVDLDVGATGRSPLTGKCQHQNEQQCRGATGRSPLQPNGPKPRSIGSFMSGFRSVVTKQINIVRKTPGVPVWQRNYYEHIVRDQDSLDRIRQYIVENPLKWYMDSENPVKRG